MYKILFLGLLLFQFTCNDQNENGGIDLLKNDSLAHFDVKGGMAEYKVEKGILTGVADKDIPNTFLTTKKEYEDFALSFSVKVDPRLNSGVQIRSELVKDDSYEMLKGYQVEIDPSDRAWSGGIYEERGRGWIANLSRNPKGKKAFNKDDWNDYFIIVRGNQIRVWVNEVMTCLLYTSPSPRDQRGSRMPSSA